VKACITPADRALQFTRHARLVKENRVIVIISASLSINIARVSVNGVNLSPIPSVGRSVGLCVPGKCTVAKRLTGSGRRLEW